MEKECMLHTPIRGGGGGGWSHSTTHWCMLKQLHASGFGRTVGSIIWTNQTPKGSIRKKKHHNRFFLLFCAAQFCTTIICPGLFGFASEAPRSTDWYTW